MSHRLTGLALFALIALTACGRYASSTPATGGYRLFLEEGFNGGSQRITVRDSASGALERQLPIGTPAPDWSRYYTVTPVATSARLKAIDPVTGALTTEGTAGTTGDDPTGVAVSPSGRFA